MQISLSTRQLVNLSTIKLTTIKLTNMKKDYIHPGITIVKTETYGNFCNYNSTMSDDQIGLSTEILSKQKTWKYDLWAEDEDEMEDE